MSTQLPASSKKSTEVPASDDVYNEAVKKGDERLALMNATNKVGSRFRDFPALFKKWGWSQEPLEGQDPLRCDMGQHGYGIRDALDGVTISPDIQDWDLYYARHDHDYEVNGKKYRTTGGYVGVAINQKNGVWLCPDAYAPAHEGLMKDPQVKDEELPELQRVSDVLWGQWVDHHTQKKTDMSNLNYIVHYLLSNPDSKSTLIRALRTHKQDDKAEVEPWEKMTRIPADSESGKAILGMKTTACAVFFLTDHQKELGKKKITAFDVFMHTSKNNREGPSMIYHIGAV
ncbi:hypothetical protein K491DRAFT_370382 [Lophiostoma macrostomum CBS 122681]|uniref:Uncharacterized protein n=1 Tax=Lophiostoma macrostomum CBS 122681 TaxID=1314788 RepID=A0A6A6T9I8_9PLEO|nr:hypothetical protein K491DRAFT_370382 [Lophiostoma macrostomum CBS 122681]